MNTYSSRWRSIACHRSKHQHPVLARDCKGCSNGEAGDSSRGAAPAFLSTSATMGTVELTGLLMTAIHAFGQCWAMPSASPATMSA